jgi:hypothetical protein
MIVHYGSFSMRCDVVIIPDSGSGCRPMPGSGVGAICLKMAAGNIYHHEGRQ